MEYKKIDCKSYNIHTIKTDKFKTIRMEIVFSCEVEKDKMPVYSFLSDLMSDASKKYKSRKEIAIRLEELYKANFYSSTNKTGKLFTVSFILEFINPTFINEKDYLENVIKLPFEIINNPYVQNGEFNLTNFNIVRKRIKEEIDSIKESSEKSALISALQTMDDKSPSSYRVLGTLEDIDNITPSNLYDAYLYMFEHFNCNIFLIGDTNFEKIISIIKDNFKNRVIKMNNPILNVINNERKKAIVKKEESNFVQSTLVMIYNITNLTKKEKNIDFHIFNYIYGAGGLNSKLYDKLRNKNSLCYSVRSMYFKYDNLLVVLVSLDNSNVKKAEKLISECLDEMVKGKFTSDELEDAKKNLIFSLKMGLDNNVSILNNYMFNYLDELPLIDERIKLLNNVEKEEVVKCAKSLKLNTIYIQESGDTNGRN